MHEADTFLDFYDPDFYEMKIGPGNRVDVAYSELGVEEGGPVLELCCGTGEVVLAIARQGIEVCGIDGSVKMLARARENIAAEPERVRSLAHVVEARMESFHLNQIFRQVFMTNDILAHLLDYASLKRALTQCATHLCTGGRIVMDVAPFDVSALGSFTDPENSVFRFRGSYPVDALSAIQVWERTVFENGSGLLTAHFRYEKCDKTRKIVEVFDRILHLHPRRPEEIVSALEACGFERIAIASAYAGTQDLLIKAYRP